MHMGHARNAAARDEFQSTNLISNLISVMQQQTTNSDLASKCCKLLTSFTCNNGHFKDGFVHAGAAEAVMLVMQKFPNEKMMQRCGCLALNNLVNNYHDDSGATRMVQAGAIPTLLLAVKTHSQCRVILQYAYRSLWTIIHYHPICSIELMANGIIESVLAAMTLHLKDPKVQSNACGFLDEFCKSHSEGTRRIKEQFGVMVVGATEHYHRGKDKNVENRAGKLLQTLCNGSLGGLNLLESETL
jgi:hypothetical protein